MAESDDSEDDLSPSNLYKGYKRLTTPLRETMVVRLICSFNSLGSYIYCNTLHHRTRQIILETLTKTDPPYFVASSNELTTTHLRWFASRILKSFGENIDFDVFPFLFRFLQNFPRSYKTILLKYLRISPPPQDFRPKEVEAVLNLISDFPPLYYGLYDRFKPLIDSSDSTNIFKKYGFRALDFIDVDRLEIESIQLNNMQDITSLTKYPICYTSEDFLFKIQHVFFMKSPYPNVTFFGGNSKLASLFNTSAVTQVHFVDIAFNSSIAAFRQGDFDLAKRCLALFPELYQWAIVAIIFEKLDNFNWISSILTLVKNETSKNIVQESIVRISNDVELLINYTRLFGQRIKFEDLTSISLPKQYDSLIFTNSWKIFDELKIKQFFSFTDEERDLDIDFIYAYLSIADALNGSNADSKRFSDIVKEMEHHLSSIKDPDRLQALIYDLYSVLFVQSEGNFLWKISNATLLISHILTYNHDVNLSNIMSQSLKRLQIASYISKTPTIEYAFTSFNYLLSRALISRDYTIIEQIILNQPELSPIYHAFKAVDTYPQSNSSTFELPLDAAEIALVYKGSQNAIKYLKDHPYNQDDVMKLIATRETRSNPLLCNYYIEKDSLKQLDVKLQRLTANSWKTDDIAFNLNNSRYLKSFFDYLNILVPTILKLNNLETVYDVLRIDPKDIISQLLKENHLEDAKKIAELFKSDIVENVLRFSPHNIDSIMPMIEKYPIVAIAQNILYHPTTESTKAINHFSALSKEHKDPFMHKRTYQTENPSILLSNKNEEDILNEIEKIDSISQIGINESNCTRCLRHALTIRPLPHKLLVDLSYRMDNTYVTIIEQTLGIIPISEINDILAETPYFELYMKVNILNEVEKQQIAAYPLKNAFSQLLESNLYSLATRFCKYFQYQIPVSRIIREEVLKQLKDNKDVTKLLKIAPHLRTEIIESLPIRFKEAINHSKDIFFTMIPKDWKTTNDPISTIMQNISDRRNVLKILKHFKNINLDKELLAFSCMKLNESSGSVSSRISYMIWFIHQHIKMFRNVVELIQFSCKQLYTFTSQIEVTDGRNELLVAPVISHIYSALLELLKLIEKYQAKSNFVDGLPKLVDQIQILRDIIFTFMSTRYNVEYTFNNFTSTSTGEELFKLCYDIDYVDLAERICHVWKLDSIKGIVRDEYSMKLAEIGLWPMNAEDRKAKTSQRTSAIVQKYIDIFTHASFFDPSMMMISPNLVNDYMAEFEDDGEEIDEEIDQGYPLPKQSKPSKNRNIFDFFKPKEKEPDFDLINSFECDTPLIPIEASPPTEVRFDIGSLGGVMRPPLPSNPPKKMVTSISNEVLKKRRKSITSTSENEKIGVIDHFYKRIKHLAIFSKTIPIPESKINMLKKYLKTKAPAFEKIRYFSSIGNFEKSIKYFRYFKDDQNRWNCFRDGIFLPAIISWSFPRLRYHITQNQEVFKEFGPCLDKLLNTADNKNLIYLKYEIEILLKKYGSALITAISIFKNSYGTRNVAIKYLNKAQQALYDDRKSNQNRTQPNEVIEKFSKTIPLQKKFCDFCIQNGIDDVVTLNLFSGSSIAESMIVFLFKSLEFSLGVQIMSQCEIDSVHVAYKMIDMLLNEESEHTILFMQGFEEKVEEKLFKVMLTAMLHRLYYLHANFELLCLIIFNINKYSELKCMLYIEYGYLEEALQFAKSNKILWAIPVIGNTAFRNGNIQMSANINHQLDRINPEDLIPTEILQNDNT